MDTNEVDPQDYTVPMQNEDAQTGTNDWNIEKTGVDLSNPGSEPVNEYMSVDDFIFSDKSLVGHHRKFEVVSCWIFSSELATQTSC